MAITMDWGTKVISIPRADMGLLQTVPTEIRELDLNAFRLTLKDLEDDPLGMVEDTTHNHVAPIGIGGVTLARVVELINGYTVTFEDGQYAVNLSGANTNLADKVNVNQVSVRSSNSAGLVQTSEIEYGSFQNAITIDQTNGTAGQAYPIGTVQYPVNNLTDAKFIAQLRGLDSFNIRGNFVFGASDITDGFTYQGQSAFKTSITLTDAATITNCIFIDATISGFLDGGNSVINCTIEGLNYVDGRVDSCELGVGGIIISGTSASFINCYSGVAGAGLGQTPIIDMGGGPTNLVIRNYSGGLEIQNSNTGVSNASIDLNSGRVIFDTTVSTGVFSVRGIGSVTDNSTGTAVVTASVSDNFLRVINEGVKKASKLIPHNTSI
jgi:hypothetical protein